MFYLDILYSSKKEKVHTLLCITYGGGFSSDYTQFSQEFSKIHPDYNIISVTYPGKGRINEKDENIKDLSINIVNEMITNNFIENDVVVYAHCVGTALGIALTQEMESRNISVKFTCIGGTFFPEIDNKNPRIDYWKDIPKKEILHYLKTFGWNDVDVNPDMTDIIINNLKHDVYMHRSYFYSNSAFTKTKIYFFMQTMMSLICI